MSIPYLVAIDLTNNELQNVRLQSLASDPSSLEAKIYYNSVAKEVRYYNGTAWIPVPGSSGGTVTAVTGTAPIVSSGGTTPAISIVAATGSVPGSMSAADKTKLDAAASIATVSTLILRDASGRAQVVDPSAAADIATKNYVDAVAQALDPKPSVRLATAAALPANSRTTNVLTASGNGALTVDGVAVALNDRLLVKNEATGANNGVYFVSVLGTGGVPFQLTRATDADVSAEVTPGQYVFVEEGTANADTGWVLTTNAPITLNTTALVYTQFSGAGSYTAGNGLSLTGTVFAVVAADSTITVAGGGISVTSPKLKYSVDVGDNSSTAIVLTHNLGTRDVQVEVYRNSTPWDTVICDVERTSTNTVTLRFAVAPTSAQFRATVLG